MKTGVLFDLDGTLWDSSREVTESWLLALTEYPKLKEGITREAISSVMGKTMTEIADILFAGLPSKERLKMLEHCMKVENEYIASHGGQLMEGLEETLKQLKKQYHLFVVSNCQTGYIEAFFRYHKLDGYFDDYESFGGTGRPKGENIRLVVERNHLDAAVYVGDTQGDLDAASYAGIPFVHARTGYGCVRKAVPYIESLPELPGMLKNFFDTLPQSG